MSKQAATISGAESAFIRRKIDIIEPDAIAAAIHIIQLDAISIAEIAHNIHRGSKTLADILEDGSKRPARRDSDVRHGGSDPAGTHSRAGEDGDLHVRCGEINGRARRLSIGGGNVGKHVAHSTAGTRARSGDGQRRRAIGQRRLGRCGAWRSEEGRRRIHVHCGRGAGG